MKRIVLLLAFAIAGAHLGGRLGDQLDTVFTGLGTVGLVGMLFGTWAGAFVGGDGLARCYRSMQRANLGIYKAAAIAALCMIGAAVAVPSLTDSSYVPPGFTLGIVFALYRFSRTDGYRFVFAALLFGAFVGAAISVAGSFEPIAKAIQTAQEYGVQHFIDSAREGHFHHSYWGRDREEFFIISALAGLVLGATICLKASFVASLLLSFWQGFKGQINDEHLKRKPKRKRP